MANSSSRASALAAFDAAPPEAAAQDVLAWCSCRAFAETIAAGRPYREPAALGAAVDAAFASLSWDDIVESMNAHPRIGDRTGSAASAAEQSGAATASEAVRHGLAEGNLAYTERFGHIFLICASGLSGQDMLTQLRARLKNDHDAERTVVRQELLKITRLRMAKLLSPMSLSTHVLDATTGRPAAGLRVRLERSGDDGWAPAGAGTTGPDGRLSMPGDPAAGAVQPGVYRITFDSGAYFTSRGAVTFYPEVSVTFEMTERDEHYHVPLLLSPFAYSTYRGS